MSSAVRSLLDVLTLEQIEDDIFRGQSPETSSQRLFGGQVLGQSVMAVGRTVPADRSIHSLHGYFLRPGDPHVPVAYVVERPRDGRSFNTRRVLARQHGRPIFQMAASFQVHEDGLEHQISAPPLVDPDSLPTLQRILREQVGMPAMVPWQLDALEIRTQDGPALRGEVVPPGQQGLQVWFRACDELPQDPLIHAAVLAFASDLTLLASALVPHEVLLIDPRLQAASLDHAMWFHRELRSDRWLLHDVESPSASNARGLGRGRVFDQDGRLVATTVQEGLIRLHD